MKFLLDANVVSYFIQAQRMEELGNAARCCRMGVVGEVKLELEKDPKRGNAFKRWFSASNLEVVQIEVGAPASATLAALVGSTTTDRDLGERASIAVAADDPSLTFVTNDKKGSWIALREIWAEGERILGLAVFLRRLFESDALRDPQVLDEVMNAAGAQAPTWWPTWRGGLLSKPSG